MGTRLETTAYGAAALDRLRAVVAELKRDDPMTPVTLLLPNNTAGLVARRRLAAGPTDDRPGVAAIQLATLPRLAEQLAAASLAPRLPATRPVLTACWRAVLSEAPGAFAAVAGHPATIQALSAAHRELRDLGDDALDRVAAASGLGPDLVRLHRAVTATVQASWYDDTDLLHAAAGLVAADPGIAAELGALVLYLPQQLTQAEARFADVLGQTAELTVLAGLTGVRRADRTVRRSLERLGLGDGGGPRPPTATHVLTASDADDEVRCVIREVMRDLTGTPAHRIAVLYSNPTPYARLLHEHLGAAGVTVNGPGTRPVHERAVARTLLELLRLPDRDFPRADLFRALAAAPVRDFTGERISVPPAERVSRHAGVVSGDDWDHRLARYAATERATAGLPGEDPPPARALRQAELAEALRSFVLELRDRLRKAAELRSWPELSAWGLELFEQLIGDGTNLPEEEQYAAVAIGQTLRGLATLDTLGAPASLAILRDVLEIELELALPRAGTFGTGVLVAPLAASIGLACDVVYVLGLSEDLYPGRLPEDALLPERVRAAAAPELAAGRDRLDQKHRHLLAALTAGSTRVVASFPRGDLRRSSRRLPSRWLLPTLRGLSGDRRMAATGWDRADYGDRLITSASYAGSLRRTDAPANEQDWRVRTLSAGGTTTDRVVLGAREMLRARASAEFTRYDGNLAGAVGLPDFARSDRPVSPTQLETYATCPHGYFVERLLQVEPIEQPEELLVISPLQVGNLMHHALDELTAEQGDTLPSYGEPWSPEQRERLTEIAHGIADRLEAEGLTGHPRLWQRERARIFADLAYLLSDDDRWRARLDARVAASELRFGMAGHPPVEIPVPSGRVLLRGSADRVDVGRDGTIYVTDVKTGGPSRFKVLAEDPVAGGTKLQLPVYAHAARARLGGDRVEASYWFVRKERGTRIPVPLTPEVEQLYAATLETLVSSIAAGLFPARAPEVPDFAWIQCPYCNPDGIGHSEVRARWERKRLAPALRSYVALVEPTALGGRDA